MPLRLDSGSGSVTCEEEGRTLVWGKSCQDGKREVPSGADGAGGADGADGAGGANGADGAGVFTSASAAASDSSELHAVDFLENRSR